MKGSEMQRAPEHRHFLNAVALQNAVLCAECEVVSDSPHDTCLVCGSRSLFNVARIFGEPSEAPGNSDRSRGTGTPNPGTGFGFSENAQGAKESVV
jgi:hypothetical protein